MMGLFSFLKPNHGKHHHSGHMSTRKGYADFFNALPVDKSREMIETDFRVRCFLYPDKKTRNKRFVELYGQERLDKLTRRLKRGWRGLCVYHRFNGKGELREAHLWVRYRTWRKKSIPNFRVTGHELVHAIDKYQERIGGKDIGHPDEMKLETWWTE